MPLIVQIALKFGRHISSNTADMSTKFQSNFDANFPAFTIQIAWEFGRHICNIAVDMLPKF